MDIYQILRVQKNADKAELQAKYLRMLDAYQLTVTFAEEQEVADIARLKLEQLIFAGNECGLYSEYPESHTSATPQTEISSIKLALNSSKADVSKLRGSNISGKIDALPESAEKHYLKAIVYLRTDCSFQGCQNAVDELNLAISLDPTNEAYIGLLDAIREQLEDFEQRERVKAEQDEIERLEQERRSRAALASARRRQFCGNFCGTTCGCICECCSPICGC